MTLLVAGVLLGIGVPNVMEMQRNGAMTAAANDLVTAALMARAEAVKRQAPTALCLTTEPLKTTLPIACATAAFADSPTHGVIVWSDDNENGTVDATDGNGAIDANEDILMRVEPQGDPLLVSANCGHVSYAPTGFPRTVAGICAGVAMPRVVLFCDDRGRRMASGTLSSARALTIDRIGRGQVFQEVADVNGWIGTAGATCP